jgi:DNA-directed RNA polymerase subunit F
MVREILEEKPISLPQIKAILDRIVGSEQPELVVESPVVKKAEGETGEDEDATLVEADKGKKYYLKSTYEYVKLFAKLDAKVAESVINKLVQEDGIPLLTAIQIVNINPDTSEELALFFEKSPGKKYSKEELDALLFKIRQYKEM